jgi:hypothetical protein
MGLFFLSYPKELYLQSETPRLYFLLEQDYGFDDCL